MNHHQSLTLIRWEPPREGWVKLNLDGSRDISGNMGCMGLNIGTAREWLGGFANIIGICSAYFAEFWGVLEGVRLALRLGFKSIEVNMFSLQVVKYINAKDSSNTMGRNLIPKIRSHM